MRDQATHPGAATSLVPGGDSRLGAVDAVMRRHHYRPDALIEVLHVAQETFGYLDRDQLLHVARGLKIPASRVYGVATFYHLFTLTPKGAHTCVVCLGTACHVQGAEALLEVAEQMIGIHSGQTTPDGRVSLDTARCVGTCGLAPLVVLDGRIRGHQTPESARRQLEGWGEHGSPG